MSWLSKHGLSTLTDIRKNRLSKAGGQERGESPDPTQSVCGMVCYCNTYEDTTGVSHHCDDLPLGGYAQKSVGELRRTFSLHYRGVGSLGSFAFSLYPWSYYSARLDGNLPFSVFVVDIGTGLKEAACTNLYNVVQ